MESLISKFESFNSDKTDFKTYKRIKEEKGEHYTIGYNRAKKKEITEKELNKIRKIIKEEIHNYAESYFLGNKYPTEKLERYVGLMDGYEISENDIF